MEHIYIIFLILPAIIGFVAFFAARQLRALQNVPSISRVFVQYRWPLSIVNGIFINAIFFLLVPFLEIKLPEWIIVLAFVILSMISVILHYIGTAIGWGDSSAVDASAAPSNQASVNGLTDNIMVDETLDSVKITITARKKWGWFALSLFNWLMMNFFALPIAALLLIVIYLPAYTNIPLWLVVGGLVVYVAYTQFQKVLGYVYDEEKIEIDDVAVTIEQCGLGLKRRRVYPAERIKMIIPMFPLAKTTGIIQRSLVGNSNISMFVIVLNRGLNRRSFGRGVDLVAARNTLEIIYNKFPQYKG